MSDFSEDFPEPTTLEDLDRTLAEINSKLGQITEHVVYLESQFELTRDKIGAEVSGLASSLVYLLFILATLLSLIVWRVW